MPMYDPNIKLLADNGGTRWLLYDSDGTILDTTFDSIESNKFYHRARRDGGYVKRLDLRVVEQCVCFEQRKGKRQ